MKTISALALALLGAALVMACTKNVDAMTADQIEQKYGLAGAFTDTIQTGDGSLRGTLVPITLANGRQAELFIPQRQAGDEHDVYLRDETGLHPVQLKDNVAVRS